VNPIVVRRRTPSTSSPGADAAIGLKLADVKLELFDAVVVIGAGVFLSLSDLDGFLTVFDRPKPGKWNLECLTGAGCSTGSDGGGPAGGAYSLGADAFLAVSFFAVALGEGTPLRDPGGLTVTDGPLGAGEAERIEVRVPPRGAAGLGEALGGAAAGIGLTAFAGSGVRGIPNVSSKETPPF